MFPSMEANEFCSFRVGWYPARFLGWSRRSRESRFIGCVLLADLLSFRFNKIQKGNPLGSRGKLQRSLSALENKEKRSESHMAFLDSETRFFNSFQTLTNL
jgi:hypothetical protein